MHCITFEWFTTLFGLVSSYWKVRGVAFRGQDSPPTMHFETWLLPTLITALTLSTTAAAFTCKSATFEPCKCEESDNYHVLRCRKDDTDPFDVAIGDNKCEIDCLYHEIPEIYFSLYPNEQISKAEYFGFENCALRPNETLAYVTSKLINTTTTEILSIKYTNVTHIQRSVFAGLKGVQIFSFERCYGVSQLPEDLLYDFPDLTSINLYGNDFATLPERLFEKSTNLEQISIGNHNFQTFPKDIFANLTKIVKLILYNNKLKTILPDHFVGLSNLEILELMTNQLEELPVDIFYGFPYMRNISLRSNYFRSFPEGLFAKNPELIDVQLSNNAYLAELPPGLLSNLSRLESVVLTSCNLSSVPQDLFWGSGNLRKLLLDRNKLRVLPQHLFRDTTSLEHLDLRLNNLQVIEDGAFDKLSALKFLNLAQNHIVLQQTTLRGLKNLENLNLQKNNMPGIPKDAFKTNSKLVQLDLSYNQLTLDLFFLNSTAENHSPLSHLSRLTHLYLQYNLIEHIFSDWTWNLLSLVELDLSYNKIKELTFSDLNFHQHQRVSLNLEQNEIETIDLSFAELALRHNFNYDLKVTSVNLRGNPLRCDCRVYDLIRYFDGSMDPLVLSKLELKADDLICQSPPDYSGIKIGEMKSKSLICILNDGPKTPENCLSKYYRFRQWDNRIILDCSNNGLKEVPKIDWDTFTQLNLRPDKLQWLKVQVNLNGNKLRRMPGPGSGYENVVELDVSNNEIEGFSWVPPGIRVLKLHGNQLENMNGTELALLNRTTLENVTFHNNPWKCDCKLLEFTNYLQENFKLVLDLPNITCASSPFTELTNLSKQDLCPVPMTLIITLSVLLGSFGIIVGLLTFLYFRYRLQIKVFLYARNLCLFFITEQELDSNKEYDAFISFSHEDEDFVTGDLIPGLEQGPTPFKLCLHYRNWLPGEFITTNIARSIDESRRTIVVLSKNFLRSEWGKMEFKTAHTEAMKEGRARVIVVMYGDIEEEEMDKEIKAYLKTKTYIKWGSPWFWDNLRYAMPHNSSLATKYSKPPLSSPAISNSPSNCVSKQPLPTSASRNSFIDEHTDLIQEPATPAATTPPADIMQHRPRLDDPLLEVLSPKFIDYTFPETRVKPYMVLNVELIDGNLVNRQKEKVDLEFDKGRINGVNHNNNNNNNSIFSKEVHALV